MEEMNIPENIAYLNYLKGVRKDVESEIKTVKDNLEKDKLQQELASVNQQIWKIISER